MNGPEHLAEAERLRACAISDGLDGLPYVSNSEAPELLAAAQVHATLALAIATAFPQSQHLWHKAMGESTTLKKEN